jgi:hypothetical protein
MRAVHDEPGDACGGAAWDLPCLRAVSSSRLPRGQVPHDSHLHMPCLHMMLSVCESCLVYRAYFCVQCINLCACAHGPLAPRLRCNPGFFHNVLHARIQAPDCNQRMQPTHKGVIHILQRRASARSCGARDSCSHVPR